MEPEYIPMPEDLHSDDGNGLPVESTGEIESSFELARLRALALRSSRIRDAEIIMPETECEVLESDRSLKYEVFKLLLANQTCETISDHIARIKGVLIHPKDVLAFRNTIPEEYFLPTTYLSERQQGLDVAVEPVSEVYKVLRLMEERLGAAALVEEVQGFPNSATTTLAESYFNMLLQAVKLRQSLGDIPEKAALALPATVQRQSDAPSVQAVLVQLIQQQGPQPPVQSAVEVGGEVIEAEVRVLE